MSCISVRTNDACTNETAKFGCYCLFPQAESDFETYFNY